MKREQITIFLHTVLNWHLICFYCHYAAWQVRERKVLAKTAVLGEAQGTTDLS